MPLATLTLQLCRFTDLRLHITLLRLYWNDYVAIIAAV